MRIVTWNMGCGPTASAYRKSHGEAWDYLLYELRPDVTLVQEALVTKIHDARRDRSVPERSLLHLEWVGGSRTLLQGH
jgi:hypothetical protein